MPDLFVCTELRGRTSHGWLMGPPICKDPQGVVEPKRLLDQSTGERNELIILEGAQGSGILG